MFYSKKVCKDTNPAYNKQNFIIFVKTKTIAVKSIYKSKGLKILN